MNGIKINKSQKLLYEKLGYWKSATLLDRWNNAVSLYGEKEFVVADRGRRCTYAQIDHEADTLAAHLEKCGIGAKDVVTFQITPRSEFIDVLIACLKIGAVPAPLGMCFVEEELKGLLSMLRSKLHISVKTQTFALIGSPVGHSGSPAMYNYCFEKLGFDSVYVALDVTFDRLRDAMAGIKAMNFRGINITMPCKSAVQKAISLQTPQKPVWLPMPAECQSARRKYSEKVL